MPFDKERIPMMIGLVVDHEELEDQPLVLAIYYASKIYPNDFCLFEVAEHFGYDEVAPDGYMSQVGYGSTPQFPLPNGSHLVLLLTNPTECIAAVKAGWNQVKDVQDAITNGEYEVLYSRPDSPMASELLNLLTKPMVAA